MRARPFMPGMLVHNGTLGRVKGRCRGCLSESVRCCVCSFVRVRLRALVRWFVSWVGVSGGVSVSPIRLSRLVDVSVESPNRNEAALMANTIVSKFLEQEHTRKRGKLTNAVDFLQTEAANLSDQGRGKFWAWHLYTTEASHEGLR